MKKIQSRKEREQQMKGKRAMQKRKKKEWKLIQRGEYILINSGGFTLINRKKERAWELRVLLLSSCWRLFTPPFLCFFSLSFFYFLLPFSSSLLFFHAHPSLTFPLTYLLCSFISLPPSCFFVAKLFFIKRAHQTHLFHTTFLRVPELMQKQKTPRAIFLFPYISVTSTCFVVCITLIRNQ